MKEESNLTREVETKVISKLQALGHTVIKCYKDTCSSLNDSLSYRTNTANSNGIDLYPSGVNVREKKSTSSRILGTLPNGAKVNLYRKEGDWIHIYYPTHGGYVYAKYIRY
ncbi:SH3 domain-containing protein [Clostridium sporogenes]|uniref:SH3 domain-containing protein n=1 Tax=Clostridium sporogenes TaxID=1509 RepID=UPI002811531E|nr:SH3 domain-containing protein [Clostridium sporogenes]MCW6112294.1 SH3 domain-containing protein [Clostridium sporogenes]